MATKNKFYNSTRIGQYISEHNLPPSCADDMELALADVLDDADEVKTKLYLDDYLKTRPHLTALEAKRVPLDESLEAFAWDTDNKTAQGKLYKLYGEFQYNERHLAHEAKKTSPDAIKQAIADGNVEQEYSNSPFNPAKKFSSEQVRMSEIVKFMRAFGTKKTARHAAKFNVDLAGRSLDRKRA
jgi:hypothetical protein